MKTKEEEREAYLSGIPPPLPEGAWDKWGKGAVYFGALDLWCCHKVDYMKDEEEEVEDYYDGVDVYAINPNDEELPIYHVAHFSYMAHHALHCWGNPACAILGSRVYLLVDGRFWFREIVGGPLVYDAKWDDGPEPRVPMLVRPYLFSLKGNLYALSYIVPTPLYGNCLELLRDGRQWEPLEPPPCPPPEEQTLWQSYMRVFWLLGLSCIGDTKVILHIPTVLRAYPPGTPFSPHLELLVDLSCEQQFLLFQLRDGSDNLGSWTRFKIGPSDSWVRNPPPPRFPQFCPPHRSHLDIASPLLLPVLPGMLHAFGGFDSPAFSLEQVPIIWPSQTTGNSSSPSKKESKSSSYYQQSHLNTMRSWNLLHVGGTRYCAFTFEPLKSQEDRPDHPPYECLFVCTFDLVSGNEEDQPGVSADGSGKPTVYAKVVATNSEFHGFSFPIDLMAGKAS